MQVGYISSFTVRRVGAVVGAARLVRYLILGHLAVSLPIALETLGLVRADVMNHAVSGMLLASLPIFREVVPFAVTFVFYNAAIDIGGTARSSYISSVALWAAKPLRPPFLT